MMIVYFFVCFFLFHVGRIWFPPPAGAKAMAGRPAETKLDPRQHPPSPPRRK